MQNSAPGAASPNPSYSDAAQAINNFQSQRGTQVRPPNSMYWAKSIHVTNVTLWALQKQSEAFATIAPLANY